MRSNTYHHSRCHHLPSVYSLSARDPVHTLGCIAGAGQAQGRHKPPQARPGESGAFISTLPVFTPKESAP